LDSDSAEQNSPKTTPNFMPRFPFSLRNAREDVLFKIIKCFGFLKYITGIASALPRVREA
jgi:hypothetical protein